MSEEKNAFLPVEIDEVDRRLSETATRKRIPSLKLNDITTASVQSVPRQTSTDQAPSPRKPLSLEVPDYLATRLKVDAAQQSVTVRHLVLSALADAGYEIKTIDMDEDGRRLR